MKLENFDLASVVEQVGREKNINKDVIISALEEAMLSAARKKLGLEADLEAKYNEDLGEVEVYEFRRIVADDAEKEALRLGKIKFSEAKKLDPELSEEAIGEDLGVKVDSRELGRIAAQNAKQIIVQRVRDAERLIVYNEYKDRKGELVAGTVRRFERGDIILDLGRAEAVIPVSEQTPKENIRINDRVVAYVSDVLEAGKGSQIILSRAHPNLVVKLFEQEVPEIGEGIVTIESAAREPGFRTKISVKSRDSDVDPVGACVGMKGSRVQAVVQELKGEKIDIVPYDEDDARFVCNALAPAEATRVIVNEDTHAMQIVVPDEQLSLAIGRRGQNVRLASQLTSWKLDILAESKAVAEKEEAWVNLSQIKSLTELQFQTLFNCGIRTITQFILTSNEVIEGLPGFSSGDVERLKEEANIVAKKSSESSAAHISMQRIEALNLMIIDNLREEKKDLSIDFVSPEVLENLNNSDYLDAGDIALENNPSRLAQSAKIELEDALSLQKTAREKMSQLDLRLKFEKFDGSDENN